MSASPRGLGDVYKRQGESPRRGNMRPGAPEHERHAPHDVRGGVEKRDVCLLYTSDAADDM
eukprot:2326682-Alexandrium_andersonii.AAC.1